VLLLPSTPTECFDMMADAFDYAEMLQTPVIMMSDLDLGMNEHVTDPFTWDEKRTFRRGKVLTSEELEDRKTWGRYLDVDGDGIPFRTIPGTHPTKGSYFTRGSSHDEFARYSEDSDTYKRIVDRIAKKFETAKKIIPSPQYTEQNHPSNFGCIYFGTSEHASLEAMDILAADGLYVHGMRIRSFPFQEEVATFINRYDKVFVIEQNKMAQMRSLLINELEISPEKLIPVTHYDGTPVTAESILSQVNHHVFVPSN
jgi:2-oxoglutarate/2-oxoacid ferredoxin oxidoreductase subunit alpha